MTLLAVISIMLSWVASIVYFDQIGRPRPPFTFGGAVAATIQAIIITALCGRVLGWW
jgi:hypothetical protein